MLKTIEELAAILLKNKVSFDYDSECLKVNSTYLCSDLFCSACYDPKSRELILTDRHFEKVDISVFKKYFFIN